VVLNLTKNSLLFFLLFASFQNVSAEIKTKAKPSPAQIQRAKEALRKKYKISCPQGTFEVGELPPDGGAVWCEYNSSSVGRRLAHGKYTKVDSRGKLKTDGKYYQGRKHGSWKNYHPDGTLKTDEMWYSGKVVSKKKFDTFGKLIPERKKTVAKNKKKIVSRPAERRD
jgi:hypothetical protein